MWRRAGSPWHGGRARPAKARTRAAPLCGGSFSESGEQCHFVHIYLAQHWCSRGSCQLFLFIQVAGTGMCEGLEATSVVPCSQPDWSLLFPSLKAALARPEADCQASSGAWGSRERACEACAGSVIAPEAAPVSMETKAVFRLAAGWRFTPSSSQTGVLLQMGIEPCL